MASYGQLYYRVFNEYTNKYESSNTFNTANNKSKILFLTPDINNIGWEKIGIQAPPGTSFELNGQKMLMGRSGIYELENVTITSLLFNKQREYVKNEGATLALFNNAQLMLEAAESYYRDYVEELPSTSIEELTQYYAAWNIYYYGDDDLYFNKENGKIKFYTQNNDENYIKYEGLSWAEELYNQALFGIYEDTGNYTDLENIIVDYVDKDIEGSTVIPEIDIDESTEEGGNDNNAKLLWWQSW